MRLSRSAWALAIFVFVASIASLACYGGTTATIADLPNPAENDQPPGSAPEFPQAGVELPPAQASGPVRVITDGGDLQSAIDDAKPGDVIAIQPGVVVHGVITLPKKSGDAWITIKTNAPDATFPARGTRVTPADAAKMPVIESDSAVAIQSDNGAHHYRFVGIEVRPQKGVYIKNLVLLGLGVSAVEDLPHHLVFERCYIHGDPAVGARRGIALNARDTAIVDSYFSDFKDDGEDTQAICGWNGTGPFVIQNNYLEAAGENVMFGGGDPDIVNLVPSDITVRGNHMAKPLAWRKEPWTVKNLFELKNARRVLVEQNVFEYNWPQAQNGYSILFTPRNQDGGSPWSMVRDVVFRDNVVRHVSSGVNILGTDDLHDSQPTERILIRNNVFDDVSDANWGGIGNLVQVINGAADVTIDHNTAFVTNAVMVATGGPNPRFAFTNNLVPVGVYGVGGDSHYGDPPGALSTYFPGASFRANVLLGGWGPDYPDGNFFPQSVADVGFINYGAGDYRLADSSPYKHAGTDGQDIGANLDTGNHARRRAVR